MVFVAARKPWNSYGARSVRHLLRPNFHIIIIIIIMIIIIVCITPKCAMMYIHIFCISGHDLCQNVKIALRNDFHAVTRTKRRRIHRGKYF